MQNKKAKFEHSILLPLVERSITYLRDDLEIGIESDKIELISPKKIDLKKNTSMIGIGGSVQLLMTIGYDDELLDKLVEVFLEGEEIEDEDELQEIKDSVSCEILNTIVGNALKNPVDNTTLSITPPILISEAKSLSKQKDSQIAIAIIKTEFGELLLTVVGPKELFTDTLNFKEL